MAGFTKSLKERSKSLQKHLKKIKEKYPEVVSEVRGHGLIYGLVIPEQGLCSRVSSQAFEEGLVIELAGANSEVLKLLPSLIIDETTLAKGCNIIDRCIDKVINDSK